MNKHLIDGVYTALHTGYPDHSALFDALYSIERFHGAQDLVLAELGKAEPKLPAQYTEWKESNGYGR